MGIKVAVIAGMIVAAVLHNVAFGLGQNESARSPDGKVELMLQDGPCAPDVLKFIPPPMQPHFKGGTSQWDGKPFNLCWAAPGDGSSVLMFFSDGEHIVLPAGEFRPAGARWQIRQPGLIAV